MSSQQQDILEDRIESNLSRFWENDPAKACNSNGAVDSSALKELPEVVMAKLMREKYTMEDARQQRQPREVANNIIRNSKSAELHSAFDQMLVI